MRLLLFLVVIAGVGCSVHEVVPRPRYADIYVHEAEGTTSVEDMHVPIGALRPVVGYAESEELSIAPRKSWPVRAIYISTSGVFEFDEEGRIITTKDKWSKPSMMTELLYKDQPLWSSPVYYRVSTPDVGSNNLEGVGVYSSNNIVFFDHKHACPGLLIESINEDQTDNPILSGDCGKAIKRRIGRSVFWVYPIDKDSSLPSLFWSVQYFGDPVTSVVDVDGKCLLYCK